MSGSNSPGPHNETSISSLITGLLFSLLRIHIKLPYYHVLLSIQYEIVTLNICKIFKLRISSWILQWLYVLRLLAHELCNIYVLICIGKFFWTRVSSLIKHLYHTFGVNVFPSLCGNWAESSLRNAFSQNLQEKSDVHNRCHPASICLESTVDMAIFCHQQLWSAKAGDSHQIHITFKSRHNMFQHLSKCKLSEAKCILGHCLKEKSPDILSPLPLAQNDKDAYSM